MASSLLNYLQASGPLQVTVFFLLVNFIMFAGSVASCWLTAKLFARRRMFAGFEPFSRLEFAAALCAVTLNSAWGVVGWKLWTSGWIELQEKSFLLTMVDLLAMLVYMDFAMYVSHRMAHIPILFKILHAFHHRHEKTNPISLFVLHPLEVTGFGSMIVVFLLIYQPMSPSAILIYLGLNLVFGTLGHCGVEPFPRFVARVPVLNLIGTSTFHGEHHADSRYNFGFYTLFWDWLFGTLDPDYSFKYENPGQHLVAQPKHRPPAA